MEHGHEPSVANVLQPTQHGRQPDWHTTRAVAVVYVVQQERGWGIKNIGEGAQRR